MAEEKKQFNFNRWIEATKIEGGYAGEHTKVLILTDPKEIHFPSPEFQHCDCLIRFSSPGHAPCMSGPVRIERRTLESWGVLPREIDEQSK